MLARLVSNSWLCDPPTSASQSAGITGLSCGTWPRTLICNQCDLSICRQLFHLHMLNVSPHTPKIPVTVRMGAAVPFYLSSRLVFYWFCSKSPQTEWSNSAHIFSYLSALWVPAPLLPPTSAFDGPCRLQCTHPGSPGSSSCLCP